MIQFYTNLFKDLKVFLDLYLIIAVILVLLPAVNEVMIMIRITVSLSKTD